MRINEKTKKKKETFEKGNTLEAACETRPEQIAVLKSALFSSFSFIPSSFPSPLCAPQLSWLACNLLPTQEKRLWLSCEIKACSLLL